MSTQLPPEGISQQAWDEARVTVGEWGPAIGLDGEVEEPIVTESIARSIMAATERERERCALIADVGSDIRPDATDPLSTGVAAIANDRAKAIAAAIRKPQNDNFKPVSITGEIS